MKDELVGKVMTEFARLIAKTYSCLIDDASEYKKAKGTKNCAIKRKLKFEHDKYCWKANQLLQAIQIENEIIHLEKKINAAYHKEVHKEFKKSIS